MNFTKITSKKQENNQKFLQHPSNRCISLNEEKKALRLHFWFDITFIKFLIHIRKEITFPTLIIPNDQQG